VSGGVFMVSGSVWAVVRPPARADATTVVLSTQLLMGEAPLGAYLRLFTDFDLAERFVRQQEERADVVVLELAARVVLLAFLECVQRAGVYAVAFDPPDLKQRVRVVPIVVVIDLLHCPRSEGEL
jgi:hypothetical protein